MSPFKNRVKKLQTIEGISTNRKQSVLYDEPVVEISPCDFLAFDFSKDADSIGWFKNYSNYPYNDPNNDYNPDYNNSLINLPLPLDSDKKSFRLKINNINSNSFGYLYKQLTLAPQSSYEIKFIVELSTNISKTYSDEQKDLNKQTVLKVGATNLDQILTAPFGTPTLYQTNFDIGDEPKMSGTDVIAVNDIHNNHEEPIFSTIALDSNKFTVKTNENGKLWILAGVHSSSNLPIEIYINKIYVEIYCLNVPDFSIHPLPSGTNDIGKTITITLPGTLNENSSSFIGSSPITITGPANSNSLLVCESRSTSSFSPEIIYLRVNGSIKLKVVLDKSYSLNDISFAAYIDGVVYKNSFGKKIPMKQHSASFKIDLD